MHKANAQKLAKNVFLSKQKKDYKMPHSFV